MQPSVSFENKALSNDEQCSSADVPQQYVQVQDPVHQLPETVFKQDNLALSAPNHQNSQFTVKQTEKLNKTQKKKSYYKKWHKEMVQRQGVYDKKQALREVYDYKTSSEYRQRHNQAMMNNYWNKMTYREKHKQAMKNNYKNNEKYRGNKNSKITLNYKNDEQFRERQKNYIIQNYRNDEQFREKKIYNSELQEWNNSGRDKRIISFRITGMEQFRRDKKYIIQNYRNEQFRKTKELYHSELQE